MSALCANSSSCCYLLPQVQLLVDFLTGNLGAAPQQQLAAKVVQLVIAGGSLGQLEALAAANPYSRQQTTDMEPVRSVPCRDAGTEGAACLDRASRSSWCAGCQLLQFCGRASAGVCIVLSDALNLPKYIFTHINGTTVCCSDLVKSVALEN